jgi:PAS domain S-box-containing protein
MRHQTDFCLASIGAMDRHEILTKAVLSTAADAIVAADSDGKIFFWNPGAERVFGFSSADAMGQSLDIIIPEQLRKRHWAGYREVMASGESRYGHGDLLAVPALTKAGNKISVEFTIVPLRGEKGDLIGLAAIMRDVTKRFEEMRKLRRQLSENVK